MVQILPALNAGGVERGTVEFAREMVKRGIRSVVISNGGAMEEQLRQEGTEHIQLPVHRKSLRSLLWIKALRSTLEDLNPDIVHVRSRIPAWMTWLAWKSMKADNRPGLVSTFHGLYSVNVYSAIMGKAQRVIAISDCVHRYILDNYNVDPAIITRIYRGLDPLSFNPAACDEPWRQAFFQEYPRLAGKKLILMPGRLSRWKGQEAFIEMMSHLVRLVPDAHGLVVGGAESNKQHYLDELREQSKKAGLEHQISFLGHRPDIQAFYGLVDVTCHMSSKPEPFGRTVPEALATGCPVVAYDRGGAAESLQQALPEGLVPPDDTGLFAQRVSEFLQSPPGNIQLPGEFYLGSQVDRTLGVYRDLLSEISPSRADLL
ncbi:MAG: glycosyltransferase family 4 protein [Ketobacteraceae bacterium]|nr:glycosyltransferase family 4 protein [Ketobacteraceae bacterium]